MFTKGYSRRVGLHNWEPSGFATGETIRRGKEELQVNAGRCEGAVPGFGPGNSRGPSREQSSPGCGGTVKESKLCRALEDAGGKGGGGQCTREQQVMAGPGAGLGPSGVPQQMLGHGAFPHSGAALHKERRSSSSLFQ